MVNAIGKDQKTTFRCSIKMLKQRIWSRTIGWKSRAIQRRQGRGSSYDPVPV